MSRFVLAIDQGTTGTTALLLDEKIRVRAKATVEFEQIYPKPGWVEHNPEAIWKSVVEAIQKCLSSSKIDANAIVSIGITNQRETTLLWERASGAPVHHAIVWQDRRTAELCAKLKADGLEELYRHRTGLVLDPYFSGTKVSWLLKQNNSLKSRAARGELCFGTVDSYLISRLTGHACHVTEVSNASRTLLFNIHTLDWDRELLNPLEIPSELLPEVKSSSEIYGVTKQVPGLPDGIPIAGAAGDQQAALFGQACFSQGDIKCTYGTGAFILMNSGNAPSNPPEGLLSSIGWKVGNDTSYVLEGSVFIAGAAVQWLRDGLNLIKHASEVEALARSVPDNGGVTFVPALSGLGAPYWNPNARGTILGITRGTTGAHIARATLEGIALQVADLVALMAPSKSASNAAFKVDGGAAANALLMQIQADLLDREIVRPNVIETTALGAGLLAGLATGLFKNYDAIRNAWQVDQRFSPQMDTATRTTLLHNWKSAIAKTS